jgi:hypothetical protein
MREKLIELLKESGVAFPISTANFLVANGVTFAKDNDVPIKWIPVSERLPEERDSIFKKLYGTKQWLPGMFGTVSDNVLVSIEREDGSRCVRYMHTQGGEWNLDSMPWAKKVTHWMPMPEPPKEG